MITKQLELAEKRVIRGALWLDKNHGGWWRQIRTTSLDMSDGGTCIIGQLNGGLYSPVSVGLPSSSSEFTMGFHTNSAGYSRSNSREYYEALDELWKTEVRKRRAKVIT